ncbi:hypothetical protein EYF80_052395 [Liparis tanakae]|uniref:Uncharacterized protein n=1 Tax=Liparis tanakae TaxID=230148 RepID=A0A4Z2F973_9TELE|nr:hypothetical protein EYF80_052395 [Liparis tanakae]
MEQNNLTAPWRGENMRRTTERRGDLYRTLSASEDLYRTLSASEDLYRTLQESTGGGSLSRMDRT